MMLRATISEAGSYKGITLQAGSLQLFELLEKIVEASTSGLDISITRVNEYKEETDDTV